MAWFRLSTLLARPYLTSLNTKPRTTSNGKQHGPGRRMECQWNEKECSWASLQHGYVFVGGGGRSRDEERWDIYHEHQRTLLLQSQVVVALDNVFSWNFWLWLKHDFIWQYYTLYYYTIPRVKHSKNKPLIKQQTKMRLSNFKTGLSNKLLVTLTPRAFWAENQFIFPCLCF